MKRFSLGLGILLTVVLVVTIFAGCAAAPAAETPKKENVVLRVAMFADASGPYAVTVGPQLDGAKDFTIWANKTNYLPGVTLDGKFYDHGLKMESAVALYKEAVTSTPTPVLTNGGLWSTVAPTLAGFAKQNKIPIIDATALREVIVPPGWFFGLQPSYEGQVGAYINWIIDNWKPDSKIPWIKTHYQNRKPRLALFAWDNVLGRANESPEVKCYAESRGVEWAGAEYVPLTVGDVTPQLNRLKGKVDFIYIGMFPSAWQAVLKKAGEMGMRDQFIDVGPSYFVPQELSKFVPQLANNTGGCGIFVKGYDELPKQIQEGHDSHGYPRDFITYAAGWEGCDVMAEALRQAVNKVGADKVTGQVVYDVLCAGAINKFKPMVACNTITLANNADLVKMDGGDSVTINLIQGWDPDKGPAENSFLSTPDVPIPLLLPGGKDVPAGCK